MHKIKDIRMKKFLTAAFLILAYNCLQAQAPAKSVYFELGGPGLASINYDMRFKPGEDGLGFRAGFGGFAVDGASLVTVPVGLNYLLGKDNRNYFELGAGATLVSAGDDYSGDTFSGTFGHLTFGYRLQPANGGFTFRAAIVPIFGQGGFIPYYAGLSFGYKF